jgi:hypothetical protein
MKKSIRLLNCQCVEVKRIYMKISSLKNPFQEQKFGNVAVTPPAKEKTCRLDAKRFFDAIHCKCKLAFQYSIPLAIYTYFQNYF